VIGQVFPDRRAGRHPQGVRGARFLNRTGAIDVRTARRFPTSASRSSWKISDRRAVHRSAFAEGTAHQDVVRLLSIIGSMISQAVKLRQKAQEERRRLIEENLRLTEELKDRFKPSNIIGTSSAIQEVYDLIAQVPAATPPCSSGGRAERGRNWCARHSLRQPPRRQAFIKVNCAALPSR